MCQYCSENKNFWDEVVAGAKRIRILTPEEVAEVERNLAASKASEALDSPAYYKPEEG